MGVGSEPKQTKKKISHTHCEKCIHKAEREVIYYAQVVGLLRGYLKEVSRSDISTGWLEKEPSLHIFVFTVWHSLKVHKRPLLVFIEWPCRCLLVEAGKENFRRVNLMYRDPKRCCFFKISICFYLYYFYLFYCLVTWHVGS